MASRLDFHFESTYPHPRESVFDAVVEPSAVMRWMAVVKSFEVDGAPRHVGAAVRPTLDVGGRRRVLAGVVTAHETPSVHELTVADADVSLLLRCDLDERRREETALALSLSVQLLTFKAKLLKPALSHGLRKAGVDALEALRRELRSPH